MGHSERVGAGLYQNVPGNYETGLFESFVEYYK
jgi:phosphoribosylformylglycinamidine synthase